MHVGASLHLIILFSIHLQGKYKIYSDSLALRSLSQSPQIAIRSSPSVTFSLRMYQKNQKYEAFLVMVSHGELDDSLTKHMYLYHYIYIYISLSLYM